MIIFDTMTNENRLFYTLLPITLVAIGHVFSSASGLIVWFVCSYFLFILTEPSMKNLTARKISPALAALIIVLFSSIVLFAMGFLVFRSSSGILTQLLTYKTVIREMFTSASTHFNDLFYTFLPSQPATSTSVHVVTTTTTTTAAAAPAAASTLPDTIQTGLMTGVSSFLSLLSYAALTPLLTFFMIAERDLFANVFAHLVSNEEKAKLIARQISNAVNAYFVGNLALILISFPVFCFTFFLLGVKAFFTLSVVSAIFNLVPFLGFFMAAIFPALDLMMNGGTWALALLLISVCFITHFAIANVVMPKVLGSKVDLNATTSTIALVAWGGLWGPIGFLIAIPVTAIFKIFFQHSSIEFFQSLAAFMCENPKGLHLQGFSFITKRISRKKS
jgi:predicted PurR-regulated permease PerM